MSIKEINAEAILSFLDSSAFVREAGKTYYQKVDKNQLIHLSRGWIKFGKEPLLKVPVFKVSNNQAKKLADACTVYIFNN